MSQLRKIFMLKLLPQRTLLVTSSVSRIVPCIRLFHSTSFNLKPRSKKEKPDKKIKSEPEQGVLDIDFGEITTKFEDVVTKFTQKANEIKLGKTNARIFDNLKIDVGDTPEIFTNLASTAVKGRNLVITVFDQSYNSSIISAILDSGLNLNPVQDATNPIQLKVPLPSITDEIKTQQVKLLKQEFEKFKNGPRSLNSIRHNYKRKYDKLGKGENERQQIKQFEALHKTYTAKLNEVLKNSEKLLMA